MTLLAMEGFDDGAFTAATRGWSTSGNTSAGRTGTLSIRVGDSGANWANWNWGETLTTFVFGFAYYAASLGTTPVRILRIKDGSTTNLEMFIRDTGAFYVIGAWGTSSDSATGLIPQGAWGYIEIKMTIDNTVGSYEVRINGVNELSSSGIDTQSGSNVYCDNIRFEGTGVTDIDVAYIDDVYLVDDTTSFNNDFLGDTRVFTLFPIGDGNVSNMTGSDGNKIDNWALVDESVPSSTDWVGSALEGDIDTYDMTSLSSTTYVVHGIITSVYGAKGDAGTKFLRHVLRTGSTGGAPTDNVGTSYALGLGYSVVDEIWNVNPVTSTQWTEGEINAMEVGQETRNS